MSRLSAVLAVEDLRKADAERNLTATHHMFMKPDLLTGLTRTYTPFEDGEEHKRPPQSTGVQVSVEQALPAMLAALIEHWDVVATKDYGNTVATADVKIGDTVLIPAAPVSYLLWLEKQLVNMATFVQRLPVLDPAEEWHLDENSGVYRTAPVGTLSTKKVPRNHVKAAATDKHPAQVELYHEDTNVGRWDTTKLSGAVPAVRRNELLARVRQLQAAVKTARDTANATIVEDRKVGKDVLGWLFA